VGKQTKQAYEERRAEILEAALDAFCEKGFGGTSMLDIAKRAKASKETIYAWFGNKEKLFETLLHAHSNEASAGIIPETVTDPRAFLTSVARALLNFTNARRINQLVMVTLAEGTKFEAALRILAELIAIGRADLIACFERWRALGLMDFEQDAEQICSLFVAMAQGEWQVRLSLGIIHTITPEEIDAHAKLATDMFLRAVAPHDRANK
jgi:AcrR family transcriptional regulator